MVMICIGGRQLSIFITLSLQLVRGNCSWCDGCCSGSKWDRHTQQCILCNLGYFGIDCDGHCLFPFYGKNCQLTCNCSKDKCNHVKGCPKSVCPPGYTGDFCEFECRYPNFGIGCQDECLCDKKKCDPANGCQGIGMEMVTTTAPQSRMSIDISVSLRHDAKRTDMLYVLSTPTDVHKETPIQNDVASMWTTLNRKERSMVISIMALGLLFLILTALYIRVTHRLRVQINNRGEETEDLDGNSAI